MNKKIGLGVLIAFVLIAGVYVFKNSGSLMNAQKASQSKKLTAMYAGGDCWVTIEHENITTGEKWTTREKGVVVDGADGRTYCQIAWGSGTLDVPMPPAIGKTGSGDLTISPGVDMWAGNGPLIAFSEAAGRKNFLDWISYTTSTCIGSIAEADSYLKDPNYVDEFISVTGVNETSPVHPWDGASNSCNVDSGTPATSN